MVCYRPKPKGWLWSLITLRRTFVNRQTKSRISEFNLLLSENRIFFTLINFSTIHFPLPSVACVVWYWQSQQIIYSNFTPNLLEKTHRADKIGGWIGGQDSLLAEDGEKWTKIKVQKNSSHISPLKSVKCLANRKKN